MWKVVNVEGSKCGRGVAIQYNTGADIVMFTIHTLSQIKYK